VVIPPYSHQAKEWITEQEKNLVLDPKESIASDEAAEKKSFVEQQKETLNRQEEQRIKNLNRGKKNCLWNTMLLLH